MDVYLRKEHCSQISLQSDLKHGSFRLFEDGRTNKNNKMMTTMSSDMRLVPGLKILMEKHFNGKTTF